MVYVNYSPGLSASRIKWKANGIHSTTSPRLFLNNGDTHRPLLLSHASQMPQSEGLVRGCGFSPTPIALPTTPSHQLYLAPVWLIAAGEKHTPKLTGLASDSCLLPHIPCVSAPHLSCGAPQKSTSASPHLFFFFFSKTLFLLH